MEKAPEKHFSEDLIVEHRPDLVEKYLHQFVTCANIEESDDWMIIDKNHSKIIKCKNECVGVVIYNITPKRIAEYFD